MHQTLEPLRPQALTGPDFVGEPHGQVGVFTERVQKHLPLSFDILVAYLQPPANQGLSGHAVQDHLLQHHRPGGFVEQRPQLTPLNHAPIDQSGWSGVNHRRDDLHLAAAPSRGRWGRVVSGDRQGTLCDNTAATSRIRTPRACEQKTGGQYCGRASNPLENGIALHSPQANPQTRWMSSEWRR